MKNSNEMTNEEIWEMLYPSLVKYNLDLLRCGYQKDGKKFYFLDEKIVQDIAVFAYKVGQLRNNNNVGHWQPINPKHLPKEGTKVRYARKHPDYIEGYIKIGDTGVVQWEGMFKPDWLGIKLDNPRSGFDWFDFSGHEDCLDEWIEVI